MEYGGVKATNNQAPRQVNSAAQDQAQQPGPSKALALPGTIVFGLRIRICIIYPRVNKKV